MEWRGQSTVSSAVAFSEAQRWVEEVTEKSFGTNNFRSALENGVLLCDLINKLKPGVIKRVNRLSTPIAGLDNVNVFLKACRKLGLNEAQLFHPGDLQDVSSRVTVRREETDRRLKNVLITLYWLGRKAQADPFYTGPLLNLKAFEGLLGFALSKVLEESCPRWSVRDSGYSESWYPDKEELLGQPPASYRREDSVESLDSVESRTLSAASESTLRAGSEGCGSDAEAEQGFRMSDMRDFRGRGYMPTPLRRKRGEQHDDDRTGPLIRSKSLSDIPLGSSTSLTPHLYRSALTFDIGLEAAAAGQLRQEHLRRIHGRIKETEAKWQEDLTRWKDRRRTTNSDLHRKREDRGLDTHEELLERSEQEAFCGSIYAPICYSSHTHTLAHTHPPTPHLQPQQQQHEADLTHRSRAPLSRGQAVEGPAAAAAAATSRGRLPPSEPAAQGESLPLGSLPTDLASVPAPGSGSMPGLMGSSGSPESPARMANGAQSAAPGALKVHWNSPVSSSLTGSPMARPGGPQTPYGASAGLDPMEDLQGGGPLYRPGTPAVKPFDGGSRMSSTLPRGFRRSEGSSCLSAGVTPRPFGAKTSSRVSMSKLYAKDDSHKSLLSNTKGQALFTSLPAPYGKVAPFADFERPLAPPMQSSPRQERREEGGRTSAGINQSSPPNFTASLPDYTSGPQSVESEVLHSDMRVSLNQRPNTGTDFGFQTHWDSTGARITSIQPGSPAELCHLCVGDEILAVGGHSVGHMSYTQWKDSMAEALAKGNLLMDVRRHGHAGRPEHYIDVSQDTGIAAASAAKPLTNGLTHSNVGPSQMNGGFHNEAVTLRNKGGSESAISDLQVPSISAPAGRWSWDPEEERKKHESWQREQERLLQEKYQRDQQRLEDEWRRAQQEVGGGGGGNHGDGLRGPEEHRAFEVANGGTPRPFSRQSASSPFVTSNQYPEEEAPVKAREEPVHSADSSPSKEAGLYECGGTPANQWPDESYSFATLAAADRTKSKSTPTLDSIHQHEDRGAVRVEKKLGQQMSQVEFERQQILTEMRKRTPLNRDSSWIRQRSSSSSSSHYKEPIVLGNPVRRFESLDDLHSGGSWTRPSSAASNPMRPHSAMGSVGGYRGPGRYSMGAMGGAAGGVGGGSSTLPASLSASCLRQGPWARPASTSPTPLREEMSPQRISKPLSGRRVCTRCERPLARGAAMVIESLGLCFHLACFKCVSCRSELRRPGPGSQVRVRNRQLFCDGCYGRIRGRPIPK